MSTLLAPPAPAVASPFERWHRHFRENLDADLGLPWHDSHCLTASERRSVARSIQQFQLGEFARGRGLKHRAQRQANLAADPWFVPALELFIQEEQGHSEMLGRFLDRQGIPRLKAQWVDGVFRRLRKLAGLEVCASVLVTAEVLAMPFYQALHDATRSPLLQAMCSRILTDEAAHLNYQALTLGLLRRPLTDRARALHCLLHRTLFDGTALLVWQQHRRVFRASGWGFFRYWNEAQRWFGILELKIRNGAAGSGTLRGRTMDQ